MIKNRRVLKWINKTEFTGKFLKLANTHRQACEGFATIL